MPFECFKVKDDERWTMKNVQSAPFSFSFLFQIAIYTKNNLAFLLDQSFHLLKTKFKLKVIQSMFIGTCIYIITFHNIT